MTCKTLHAPASRDTRRSGPEEDTLPTREPRPCLSHEERRGHVVTSRRVDVSPATTGDALLSLLDSLSRR